MVILDQIQFEAKSVRAHTLSGKVVHGEVALVAVKLLQALILGADVVSTGQLIELNEERAE